MPSDLANAIAQGSNERDNIRANQVKQSTISNYFVRRRKLM